VSAGGLANGRDCWFPPPRSERAVGRLYRGPAPAYLGPTANSDPSSPEPVDETRRNILKLLAVAGVLGAVGGGLGSAFEFAAKPPAVGLSRFPEVQLQDLDGSALTATRVVQEYNVGTTDVLSFDYPLSNEPNLLINLAGSGGSGGAQEVPGGVGPNGSIVAFSAICQHLGCAAPSLAFYPAGTCAKNFGPLASYIHCSCHGSTYDPTASAANLSGPADRPLPQVTLRWNRADDSLWAVGVTGPTVMGHSNTLQGGVGVGSTSRLQRQSPVVLCNFP
jgi:arsenite oxidase small subunit